MLLPGEERRLGVSGSLKDVRKLAQFCKTACEGVVSEMDNASIELAIVEAATNIVEHAYSDFNDLKLIELCINHLGNILEFRLIHQGAHHRPLTYELEDIDWSDINAVPESGRGYFLIQSLMDDIRIETKNDFNTITMYKNIEDKDVFSKPPVPLLSKNENYSKIVHEEMEIAADLHKKLLPEQLPKIQNLEIVARTEAARLVGGDYLTFYKLDDTTLYFMVCDAMGKGMSAAFFSVISHVAFRSILMLNPKVLPGELLTRANQVMATDFDVFEMFMTALVGRVDMKNGLLHYASAGHCQPIMYWPDGTLQLLDTIDFMLGVDADLQYATYEAEFVKGSRLVAYTDGVTDITTPDGEMIGVDPIIYACATEFKVRGITEACNKIFEEVKSFSGEQLQDDISIMGLAHI